MKADVGVTVTGVALAVTGTGAAVIGCGAATEPPYGSGRRVDVTGTGVGVTGAEVTGMGVTSGYALCTGVTGSTGAGAAGVGVTGVGEMGSGAATGVLLGVIGSTGVGVSCVLCGRLLVGAAATVGVTASDTASSFLDAAAFFSGITAVISTAASSRPPAPTTNVAGRTRPFPRALFP